MRKRIVLFLVLGVLISLCLQAQAASNYNAELAAWKAEIVQLKSRLTEIERALAQFNANAAKDIEDKRRLLQGVGNSIETINKRTGSAESSILALTKKQDEIEKKLTTSEVQMAALTKKQNDYEGAIEEIARCVAKDVQDRQIFFQAVADWKEKRLETGVADATGSRLFAAAKESTQGRKIIRQGSGDSYRKDSQSGGLFLTTRGSIQRCGDWDTDPKDSQPRKIQHIKKSAEPVKTVRIVHYAQHVPSRNIPSRTSYNTPRPGPDIADIWTKKDKDDSQDGFYTRVDWGFLH